ncbi:MAG TPA: hypothetical protein VH481_11245 [Nitrososphaeraceae archaeon]|jgi:phosphoribosyl 1,2-cyclic phosphodiesterase
MGKANQYFKEFVNPCTCNGMGDLFEFDLLPKLKRVYRKDYAKHTGFDGTEDNAIDAVILSHSHVDHSAYIHYLRPKVKTNSLSLYPSEIKKILRNGYDVALSRKTAKKIFGSEKISFTHN